MDTLANTAQSQAQAAISTAVNLNEVTSLTLNSLVASKGIATVNTKQARLFDALRTRLFLKYANIDYEVIMNRDFRNDKYRNILAQGG